MTTDVLKESINRRIFANVATAGLFHNFTQLIGGALNLSDAQKVVLSTYDQEFMVYQVMTPIVAEVMCGQMLSCCKIN